VKVDAAVTHARLTRNQVRDPTRTSSHWQIHSRRSEMTGALGNEVRIGFDLVSKDFFRICDKEMIDRGGRSE
jgi:hypothetical protein